jgi:hypothetical protein
LFYKKGEYFILVKFHIEKTHCGDRLVTHLRLDIKKTEVTPKLGLRKRRQQHKGHPGKFATKFHQLVFLAATISRPWGPITSWKDSHFHIGLFRVTDMVILQGLQLQQLEGLSAVRMGSAQLVYVLVKRKDTTAPENFMSNRSWILYFWSTRKTTNKECMFVI